MKPTTWMQIQNRLEENMRHMSNYEDQDEYDRMESENETMEWISICEGKRSAFTKYQQRIAIQIQAEEDNID